MHKKRKLERAEGRETQESEGEKKSTREEIHTFKQAHTFLGAPAAECCCLVVTFGRGECSLFGRQ
jgi:hypothetical protein